MKILDYEKVPRDFLPAAAVTVGNFDGVHLGHRAIVGAAVEEGKKAGVPTVVVTFHPHPRNVLSPEPLVPEIISFSERVRLISGLGPEYLFKVEFTLEFAAQSAEEFVEGLVSRVHPLTVVIGHDFRFGRNRLGNGEFLAHRGERLGFKVLTVPAVVVEGEAVSSSRIRTLIQSGEMEQARQLLGAPFSISGQVIPGHGRGRALGFATANLRPDARLLPAEGVYAALAFREEGCHPAVVNIGSNPTFGDSEVGVEAHLLDYPGGDLYDQSLRLTFLRRLRGEIKFDSPAALATQIEKDVVLAREIIAAEQHRWMKESLPVGLRIAAEDSPG